MNVRPMPIRQPLVLVALTSDDHLRLYRTKPGKTCCPMLSSDSTANPIPLNKLR